MDPYYILKQEIDSSIQKLKNLLSNREDMLNDNRGINVEIFNSLGIQMSNDITKLRVSLKDISDSIAVVRNRMEDFDISEVTLNQRDIDIKRIVDQVNNIESEILKQSSRLSMSYRHTSFTNNSTFNQSEPSNNQHSMLQVNRDQQINYIAETAQMSLQISREIMNEFDDQQKLILSIDNDMDNVQDAMKKVTNQIKGIIENEGKMPTYTVAILSIVLILLLFWVI